MSTRIEWSDTSAEIVYSAEPGFFEDQYGTINDGPAIGIFTGSDGAVLEAATPEDMIDLLTRLLTDVARAHPGVLDRGPE